jgi:hypothetical protein
LKPNHTTTTGFVLLAGLSACGPAPPPDTVGNNVCDAPTVDVGLPTALRETSGIAVSRTHAGVFWSHNDSGGDPAVIAVDSTGRVLAQIRVTDAFNRDWEDIAVGPCEPGGGDCIFIAEIGDNDEKYPHVAVYRIPEPDPATDSASAPADIFRFTYPDGPRDAEGLYVTGRGIHIVSKGRSDAIELFRLNPPYAPGNTVEAGRIQRLQPPPASASFQATAAAIDPTGRRVAVRTYADLRFFDVDGDTLAPVGRPADRVAPGQLQGEGLDFIDPNRLVVTGEARGGQQARLAVVTCDPLRAPADSTEVVP